MIFQKSASFSQPNSKQFKHIINSFPNMSQTSSPSTRLDAALQDALQQYEEIMGDPFPTEVELDPIEDTQFWAVVGSLANDNIYIKASTSIVGTVETLWNKVFQNDNSLSQSPLFQGIDIEALIHTSIMWLMHHELEHYALGHFGVSNQNYATETSLGHDFALIKRSPVRKFKVAGLNQIDYIMLERCLELQADHDAIEMILEAYSPDRWDELRLRAACISMIMVIIDTEDMKHTVVDTSHPKAATRIFQLLGHISEMPIIPAQRAAIENGYDTIRTEDLPSEQEQTAFVSEVAIPVFLDAVALAEAAGAKTILDDLGEPSEFFNDVAIAKTCDPALFDQLQTDGAKEWKDLVLINEQIMAAIAAHTDAHGTT